MSKWLFVLLGVLYLLGLTWMQILSQENPQIDLPAVVEAPAAPLPPVREVLLPLNDFQWQLPDIQLKQKKSKLALQKEPQLNTAKPLWQNISFGQCGVNPLSPAYLEQKMQRNMGDKRGLPLGNVDCGLIRTKIPFSF